MKWKKDSYLDTIDSIHNSLKLKPVIALKNCIVASPQGCIPISDVSKKGLQFDIPFKVAKFLRMYPSVFEEFTGPEYNLPWFRLTPEAIKLNDEEQCVYRDFKDDLEERLMKFVLMSVENWLPLKVIKGMLWYLGLPDDYLRGGLGECFEVVEMGDGLKGLTVAKSEKILSVIQKNALRSGVYSGGEMEAISIPLYPSKGLRLRTKILDWSDEEEGSVFKKVFRIAIEEAYFDETAIEDHPLEKGNSKMELDGGDTHDGGSLKSVYKLP
ncbi:protein root primordium defective 1 [Tanacetum coccineum]|uniref:Protein root primordium defective 1 n=1 Tax=Tanacetum coccineum TaxID=301880 RepID=A0ABQ5EZC3_9ASTR